MLSSQTTDRKRGSGSPPITFPVYPTAVRYREPLFRRGSARISVKTRKTNWRSRTIAPFAIPGARINSPSAGALILQRAMSRLRCSVFAVSSSHVAFLASSSERAFCTSLFSSLITLALVYFSRTLLLARACSTAKKAF